MENPNPVEGIHVSDRDSDESTVEAYGEGQHIPTKKKLKTPLLRNRKCLLLDLKSKPLRRDEKAVSLYMSNHEDD
jgi:hypothetical protein